MFTLDLKQLTSRQKMDEILELPGIYQVQKQVSVHQLFPFELTLSCCSVKYQEIDDVPSHGIK